MPEARFRRSRRPNTDSQRAFTALLPELRRSARRHSRTTQDADDLVQETLLRVWTRLAMAAQGGSDAAPIGDLRAYAHSTLRHTARRRRDMRIAEAEDVTDMLPAAPDAAPAHVACRAALDALGALPPEQRMLLEMRALEGRSCREIADATGLPIGTVMSRLARARSALRRSLGLPPGAPVGDLFRLE